MNRNTSIRVPLVMAFLLLPILSPLQAVAQEPYEGDSDSGNIHFVAKKAGDVTKLFLSPKGRPDEQIELFETEAPQLDIHFSPDEFWIIVGAGGSSLGTELTLFKRDKGVHYTEIKDADIGGKAERLASMQNGSKGKTVLDHRYVTLLSWSADSKSILVLLGGHGGRLHINGWHGIYDLGTGRFSFDLTKMNRNILSETPKAAATP